LSDWQVRLRNDDHEAHVLTRLPFNTPERFAKSGKPTLFPLLAGFLTALFSGAIFVTTPHLDSSVESWTSWLWPYCVGTLVATPLTLLFAFPLIRITERYRVPFAVQTILGLLCACFLAIPAAILGFIVVSIMLGFFILGFFHVIGVI